MKKINIIAILGIIGILVGWIGGYSDLNRSVADFEAKLSREGVDRVAVITSVKRYFPPKGKNGYGAISYKYQNITGKVHESSQLVSKEVFEKIKSEEKVNILYDPDKTHKNRIAMTVLRENN